MPAPINFWEGLFAAPASGAEGVRVEMRAVSKHGRPFLLLPCRRRAAVATLRLYPAQTPRARAARTTLSWLARLGLAVGTRKVSFTVHSDDSFTKFLATLGAARPRAGTAAPADPQAAVPSANPSPAGLPTFGVLAGNPASDGQRLLLLVFDPDQAPVAVVKAGLSERARSLVEAEAGFLATVPPNTNGIPAARATFQSPRMRALALDYYPGESPRRADEDTLPALLASWIDPNRKVALREAADWGRLEKAASTNELFARLARQLAQHEVHPPIQHGDFAPWNIKVSMSGAWTVLDWERGELTGIPGWDWFHYVIQPAILVEHLPAEALVERVEGLLASEAFAAYALRGGITDCERQLVLAYLLHAAEVIRPSEGLAETRELLQALAARWA